jgi:hypothetical protein
MNHNFAISFTLTVISTLIGVPASAADNPNPIHGFFAYPNGGFGSIEITTDFTDIQRLSLPPGKYIANASAQVATNSATPVSVGCIFMIGGRIKGEPARTMVGGTGTDNFASMPLTVGFSINERRELALACQTDGTGTVFSQASPITAIRVDHLSVRFGMGLD